MTAPELPLNDPTKDNQVSAGSQRQPLVGKENGTKPKNPSVRAKEQMMLADEDDDLFEHPFRKGIIFLCV